MRKKRVECKKVGCTRKGYRVEKPEGGGGGLLCFDVWHDGRRHTIKLSLEEIAKMLKEVD